MSIFDASPDLGLYLRRAALRALQGEDVSLRFEPDAEDSNIHSIALARTLKCIAIARSRGEMK